jgi:[ribosomal protein S5]-alanine N-acetyltransferase
LRPPNDRDLSRCVSLLLRPFVIEDADDLIRANRDSVAYHAPWVQTFTDRAGFDRWFAQTLTDEVTFGR